MTSLIDRTRHALTTSAPPTVHVRHNPGCQSFAAYYIAKLNEHGVLRQPVSCPGRNIDVHVHVPPNIRLSLQLQRLLLAYAPSLPQGYGAEPWSKGIIVNSGYHAPLIYWSRRVLYLEPQRGNPRQC